MVAMPAHLLSLAIDIWSQEKVPAQAPVADAHFFFIPVTGGYDPHICLWSPFISKKPMWLLKGHQTSVSHVLVNTKNSNILISVSKDKVLPLWSMALHPPSQRHFSGDSGLAWAVGRLAVGRCDLPAYSLTPHLRPRERCPRGSCYARPEPSSKQSTGAGFLGAQPGCGPRPHPSLSDI